MNICYEIGARPCTGHLPAISVDPPGSLVLRHDDGPDMPARVVTASPQLNFGDELLHDILTSDSPLYPEMRLERPVHVAPHTCYEGYLLHIDASDQHLVYRIHEYVPEKHHWVARWPD